MFILQMFDLNMRHHIKTSPVHGVADQAFPLGSALFQATRNVFLALGVVICNH